MHISLNDPISAIFCHHLESFESLERLMQVMGYAAMLRVWRVLLNVKSFSFFKPIFLHCKQLLYACTFLYSLVKAKPPDRGTVGLVVTEQVCGCGVNARKINDSSTHDFIS